ncbi:WD40 repeat domain-containing protein [Streptomyces sp. NPDC001568]|uniref:WD40 repeat domain-containing protein n=1 Tax=Streptomyces sp. NPDC001568 TaxID=3364588 RepID=UPI0036ABBEF4
MARPGHSLRQDRHHLPCRTQSRCHLHLVSEVIRRKRPSAIGTVQIWDQATVVHSSLPVGHTSPVGSVATSPDGAWLATTSYEMMRVWDLGTGASTTTLTDHTDGGSAVAFSPDSTTKNKARLAKSRG